jgi:hypothetical protein
LRGRLLPDTPVIMANVDWPQPRGGRGSGGDPNSGACMRKGLPPGEASHRPGQAWLAEALERVRAAVADGAHLVDIGQGDDIAVDAIRATSPQAIICADVTGADLTRDPAVAARTGAALVACGTSRPGAGTSRQVPAPQAAEQVPPALSDRRAGATLTEAAPAEAPALIAAGQAVLADADVQELASTIAVAAVLAWLGVRIVRTRHVAAVRQALEMVESIRGTRPPSSTRRGLA